MNILIVGSEGSMGKRYQCILNYLHVPFTKADKNDTIEDVKEMAWNSTGIILATPTEMHCEQIKTLLEFDRPILCEKPVSKNLDELYDLLTEVIRVSGRLSMMMQYKYLADLYSHAPSSYNYFRHGSDGLVWDCMQTIALANTEVELAETSPIWKCTINGKELNLADMDYAYVRAVKDWLKYPMGNIDEIKSVHEKVHKFESTYGKN